MKLKPSHCLNSSLRIHPHTFTTKVLRFVVTPRYFIIRTCSYILLVQHQLRYLHLACTTGCVTKATLIQFINSNKLKSCRTGLTIHTWPISHHITTLDINGLGGRHTGTHTYTHTDKQTKTIFWFKNMYSLLRHWTIKPI